jgi:hypothetical protein
VDVIVVPSGPAALEAQNGRGDSQAGGEMRFGENPFDLETQSIGNQPSQRRTRPLRLKRPAWKFVLEDNQIPPEGQP